MPRPRAAEEGTGLEAAGPVQPEAPTLCQVCSEAGACTHLPTPQVAAGLGLEDEDIIGVEGGGPGWDLKSLSVIAAGSSDLKEPRGGLGLRVLSPGGASL